MTQCGAMVRFTGIQMVQLYLIGYTTSAVILNILVA